MGKLHKPDRNYHSILINNVYRYFLQRNASVDEYYYFDECGNKEILDKILESNEYITFRAPAKIIELINKIDYT